MGDVTKIYLDRPSTDPVADASPASRVATSSQRRRALLVSLAIVAVTALLFPQAAAHWPAVPAFLPSYQTAVILQYGICAYLIFGHYRATRSGPLLHLGCGCLYTALILVAQFLSFPNLLVPQGVLPGGAQTTIWLWVFWHVGPSAGMLFYGIAQWRGVDHVRRESGRVVLWSALGLTLSVVVSVAAVTAFHDLLPVLDVGGDFSRINATGIGPAIEAVTLVALAVLWRTTRFRTVLHVWLGVALVALLADNAITMAGGSRLSVGWYIGRFNALVSASVLLFVYLREINGAFQKTAAAARQLAVSNQNLEAQVVEGEARLGQARLDHLTKLAGRALFLDLAEARRAASAACGQAAAILFIDLDGFKRVNDTLGHERGDQVLVAAAAVLRSVLRDADVAGRMGGDEFAACLVAPATAIGEIAAAVAGRIVGRVADIGDGIGCSIGIAPCPIGCSDLACALGQADEAMYAAKRAGKNRYVVFGQPRADGESWSSRGPVRDGRRCAC